MTDTVADPTVSDVKVEETAPAPTGDDVTPKDSILTAKPEGDDGKLGDDGKPAEVAGELTITVPEGKEVAPDDMKWFETIAKELKLSSEDANALLAGQLGRQEEAAKAIEAQNEKQHEEWVKEIEADPDYGGDKFEATKLDAAQAFRQFADKDTLSRIEELGLGNYPPLVKTFARIGRALRDDNSDVKRGSESPVPSEQDNLRKAYPTMFNADGTPKE